MVEPEDDEYPRDNELFNPFGPSPFDPEPERRSKRKGSQSSSAFEPPSFPDVFGSSSFARNPFDSEPKTKSGRKSKQPSAPDIFGSSSFARNPFEPEQKKKGKGRDKRPPWGFNF
jgi:hypothetical protein